MVMERVRRLTVLLGFYWLITHVSGQTTTQDPNQDCGEVPTIANGHVELENATDTSTGSKAFVICDTGHEPYIEQLTCMSNGQWENWDTYAACYAQECAYPNITNGILNLIDNDNSLGAIANIQCDVGYNSTAANVTCTEDGSWKDATCELIDCGYPTIASGYGYVYVPNYDDTRYNATGYIYCFPGYIPSSSNFTCLETGEWENVSCDPLDCGMPPNISNGIIQLIDSQNTTYGAESFVTCDYGYRSNVSIVYCFWNGNWTGAVCEQTGCGPLPVIANGTLELHDANNTSVGALASVDCDTGYITNDTTINCTESEKWSNATCAPVDCGYPDSIPYAYYWGILYDGTTYGNVGHYYCQNGYVPWYGNITCTKTGKWENASCNPIDCGMPPNISNGIIQLNDSQNTTYGAESIVTCDFGYRPNVSIIYCTWNGNWAGAFCEQTGCGPLPVIANGTLELHDANNTSVGALASVNCDTGHTTNDTTINCTESEKWSNATCEPVDCGDPGYILNSYYYVYVPNQDTTFGKVAYYYCDYGYVPWSGNFTCTATGDWENATCDPIDCGTPQNLTNGIVLLNNTHHSTYGAVAIVTCDFGYGPTVNTIHCLAEGEWSNSICEKLDCGNVPFIPNGEAMIDVSGDTLFEATATVSCNHGYHSNGTDVITCTGTGEWENAMCQLVECNDAPIIDNGMIEINGSQPIVGDVAIVTCDPGYFANLNVIECLQSGEWEQAFCSNAMCGNLPSIDNGYLELVEENMTMYGSLADVICDEGYVPYLPTIECMLDGNWQNDSGCTGYALGDVFIETGQDQTANSHFMFLKCAFTVFSGLTYRIKWYANDTTFLDTGIISSEEAAAFRLLDEDFSDPVLFPLLGTRFKCEASAYDGIGATELDNGTSVDFVPMEISSTYLTMTRGETTTFTIFFNLPFGCPLSSTTCSLNFLLYDPDDRYDCRDSTIAVVSPDTCGGKIDKTNTSPASVTNRVVNITIVAKNNRYYRLRSYFRPYLRMTATGNSNAFWNRDITELTVNVTENYLTRYRGCYAFVDPYVYTFDRRYSSIQLMEEFVMFRHKTLPIEVQIITSPCNGNRMTCSCAVTVRSGGDVFTINNCGGHMMGFLSYKDRALKVYRWYATYYKIVLPTGMTVYVYVMSYMESMMNVYIIPSTSDFNQSDGLCGNYNGDTDDDTLLRGTNTPSSVEASKGDGYWWWQWWGTDYFYPHDFAYSWGLEQRPEESLLNPNVYENVEGWNMDKKLCVCPNLPNEASPQSHCSVDEDDTCFGNAYLWWRWGTLVPAAAANLSTPGTRKRLARMKEKWELLRDNFQAHHIMKRQAESDAMTIDEAKRFCEEHLNSTCNSYSKKEDTDAIADSEDNLQNCAQDVAVNGSVEWVQLHCDALNTEVEVEINQDVEFAEQNPEVVIDFKNNACPGNCSSNGDCVNATCICYEGFGTDLCLISMTVPPILEEYGDEGVCDLSTGDNCGYILVVGNGFIEGAMCNVSVFYANNDGVFIFLHFFTRECVYVSFNELLAPTSDTNDTVSRRRRDTTGNTNSETARMYGISVSNNGLNFGEPKYVVVLDTTCQETDASTSENSTVTLKAGYCFISGTCYTDGTYRAGSICDVCSTSGSADDRFDWTNACVKAPGDAEESGQLGIILGSVFGSVLIIACVVVTGLYLYKRSKRMNAAEPHMPSNKHWLKRKTSSVSASRPLDSELYPSLRPQSADLLPEKRRPSAAGASVMSQYDEEEN